MKNRAGSSGHHSDCPSGLIGKPSLLHRENFDFLKTPNLLKVGARSCPAGCQTHSLRYIGGLSESGTGGLNGKPTEVGAQSLAGCQTRCESKPVPCNRRKEKNRTLLCTEQTIYIFLLSLNTHSPANVLGPSSASPY